MKLSNWLYRLRGLLFGRVARNIWFWLFLLYIAHGYNVGNDAAYHYGLTTSPIYVPVLAITFLLQGTVLYVNNLLLVPRLLARKRYLYYASSALSLSLLIGLCLAILMKLSIARLRVDELHHAAFTITATTRSWNAADIWQDTKAFLISEMFWLAAFTLAWYAADYSRQQRALRESEAQRIKTELAFLRNQLNPHFLFNTLNNIYGLVYLKSDAAPELILKLSSLLRYLLYQTNVEAIAFSKERAAIEAYAEIESLRLPDSAQLKLDLQTDADYLIPPLLWMPVLENSFKHGSRLIQETVGLDFSFRICAQQMTIRSSNRFEPAAESEKDARGLGLSILRKRLQILYPGRHEIRESVSGNLYSILINVNLSKE